jgi:hypothetical protein
VAVKINLAHIRERAAAGGWIDFAVFDARSTSGTNSDNSILLQQLTIKARAEGLKIDQSALAFANNGRITFHGSKHLVDYLSRGWIPHWTHTIDT